MDMNLGERMRQDQQRVDMALERYLPPAVEVPATIHESMRYSLFAGGKRFRPILLLEACRLVGGEARKSLPAAVAMELIHTYSLIHDDLPCMDDASLRRGKPTSHKKYGEAIAVLTGDALLTHAFEVLTREQVAEGVPTEAIVEVVGLIARAAGTMGMVGGQVLDIQHAGTGAGIRPEQLSEIHHRKTGALIVAAVEAGAVLGGATFEQRESLTAYGRNVGLAFQIADDLLDVHGTVETLGKDIAGDVARQKITFPAVFGVEASRQMGVDSLIRATQALEGFGGEAAYLRALAEFVVSRAH